MSRRYCAVLALAASASTMLSTARAAEPIWLEGEQAQSPTRQWSIVEGPAFSGEKMLRFGANPDSIPADGAIGTWKLTAPSAGEYEFWGRLGYRPWTDFHFRFDDGPWQLSAASAGFFEFIKVPVKGGDVTEACWASLGKVKLDAGEHQLQIRMTAAPGQGYVMQSFDCFVLSTTPFHPAGQFKPGQTPPISPARKAPEGVTYWPVRSQVEPATPKAIDLSFMNEPIGKHGFVKMAGGDLQFDDGTPVRFFGPNVSYWQGNLVYMDHLAADRFAEMLSGLGANCVRIHVMHAANSLIDPTRNDTQEFDAGKLDRLEYLIHALAQRNIYINLDLMYHRTFKPGDGVGEELIRKEGGPEDPAYNVSWACGAAAFWHPRVIELNLELYRKLLTRTNPYTKQRLVDMPQLAMCTIQNEQSALWGTTNMRKGETARLLDEQYTAWLKDKYKTQDKLVEAWQVAGQPSPLEKDEDLDRGPIRVGQVVQSPAGASANRAQDQVKFLYHLETSFYERWIGAMRSWGVRCPIITSNWVGSGPTTRLVLQASTLGEIVDRHIYYTTPQTMLNSIGKGLPMIGFDQQAGRAFCVSEWNHGQTGLFQAETVPLMATIGTIQGWDALFQFCAGSPTLPSEVGGITPGHYATYPLAAMIFRRGDIQTGPVIFERRRDAAYQFSFQNENRTDTTDPAALSFSNAQGDDKAQRRVPPEVLAIGRVQNAYVDQPTPDQFDSDLLQQRWDRERGIVTSAAGDVKWNTKAAYVLLDSPRTQGAFGALAGSKLQTADVEIETSSRHCALVVTSLDGKPLRESARLLITAVGNASASTVPTSTDRPAEIPPSLMESISAKLKIHTPLERVYAVGTDGHRLAPVPVQRNGDTLSITISGEQQAMWYEVTSAD